MYAGRVAGNGEVLAKSAFSLCDQGCDVIGWVLGWVGLGGMWKWIVKVIFNTAGLLDGAENRLSDWQVVLSMLFILL